MKTWEYAVVGAGPAGAMAAAALAERGRAVVLLDWSPHREKPCGGGVPARGMARFGALLQGVPRNDVRAIRLVGPRGPASDEARVGLSEPLAIFARSEFDGALRQRAVRSGAELVAARVVGVTPRADGFELSLRNSERIGARFVVAADGAAGSVKRRLLELAGTREPGAEHFSVSFTTYPKLVDVAAKSDVMELAWLRDIDGYGWTFPRPDHASIGWCEQERPRAGSADHGERGAGTLRGELFGLVRSGALSGRESETGVGALIPSYRGGAAAETPVEGARFALVGDAAGAVDPLTREGIHHALASGNAIGEIDPLVRPGRYGAWYDAEIRPELVRAARLAPLFFSPRFLTTMVRGLERSEALREVFRELIAGTQEYATLRRRLLRALPRALPALARAALRR